MRPFPPESSHYRKHEAREPCIRAERICIADSWALIQGSRPLRGVSDRESAEFDPTGNRHRKVGRFQAWAIADISLFTSFRRGGKERMMEGINTRSPNNAANMAEEPSTPKEITG
jgi:hypothetical protein